MKKIENISRIEKNYTTVTSSPIFVDLKTAHFYGKGFKTICDFFLAVILLTVSAPFLVIISLLVKLDSKGPIFFRQIRLGKNCQQYSLIKFRTMVQNAEQKSGPIWTKENDSRITSIGKWLRRFYLDEFPQLLNVIKGEMSIIGPRPERPFFVEKLVQEYPSYLDRLSVKPGITGFAQINQRYDDNISDVRKKLEFDLFYIKRLNFMFDLKILMKTVLVMISGKGR